MSETNEHSGLTMSSRSFDLICRRRGLVAISFAARPSDVIGQIDPKSCNAKGAQKGKREAKMSNYPKVFLGGLPPDVNETVLRDYFAKYGKVSGNSSRGLRRDSLHSQSRSAPTVAMRKFET